MNIVGLHTFVLNTHNTRCKTRSTIFAFQYKFWPSTSAPLLFDNPQTVNDVVSPMCSEWIPRKGEHLNCRYLWMTSSCIQTYLHNCQQCQKVGETFYKHSKASFISHAMTDWKPLQLNTMCRHDRQRGPKGDRNRTWQLSTEQQAIQEMTEVLSYWKTCSHRISCLMV
jgi:hypothetical protein